MPVFYSYSSWCRSEKYSQILVSPSIQSSRFTVYHTDECGCHFNQTFVLMLENFFKTYLCVATASPTSSDCLESIHGFCDNTDAHLHLGISVLKEENKNSVEMTKHWLPMPNFSSFIIGYSTFVTFVTSPTFDDHWCKSLCGSECLVNMPLGKVVNDCVSFGERGIRLQLSFPQPDARAVCLK